MEGKFTALDWWMGALQATAYATGISVTPLLSPHIVILDLDQDMLKEVKPPTVSHNCNWFVDH